MAEPSATFCIFCSVAPERILAHNEHAFAIRDGYPVTEGHTLVIPRRHVASPFDLTGAELAAVAELLRSQREQLFAEDPEVRGFNVGVNDGVAAGQTVMHCHVHLIPRRARDMPDPRGGVRHVIPSKGNYLTRGASG